MTCNNAFAMLIVMLYGRANVLVRSKGRARWLSLFSLFWRYEIDVNVFNLEWLEIWKGKYLLFSKYFFSIQSAVKVDFMSLVYGCNFIAFKLIIVGFLSQTKTTAFWYKNSALHRVVRHLDVLRIQSPLEWKDKCLCDLRMPVMNLSNFMHVSIIFVK